MKKPKRNGNGKRKGFGKMERIKYQTEYMIVLQDGTECPAMLIKLNKYCGNKEVWKRLDDVPRKERYVERNRVVSVR